MMDEIKEFYVVIKLIEILFVVDVMIGQDVVNIVKVFNDVLLLMGVILIKIDGDVCGGVVFLVCVIIGKLIKFLGMGEKFDVLELFYFECVVQCILGMGDVFFLVEEFECKVDKEKVEKMVKKL